MIDPNDVYLNEFEFKTLSFVGIEK